MNNDSDNASNNESKSESNNDLDIASNVQISVIFYVDKNISKLHSYTYDRLGHLKCGGIHEYSDCFHFREKEKGKQRSAGGGAFYADGSPPLVRRRCSAPLPTARYPNS